MARPAPLHRAIAWSGFVLLLALHLDFWRPQRPVVVLGWMPEELAWRLGWMVLALLYLLHFCRYVWLDPEAPAEPSGPPA